jgi:hypothetical protein
VEQDRAEHGSLCLQIVGQGSGSDGSIWHVERGEENSLSEKKTAGEKNSGRHLSPDRLR